MTGNELKAETLELKHKLGLIDFERCSAEEVEKIENIRKAGGELTAAALDSIYHRVGVGSEDEDAYYKTIEPAVPAEEMQEYIRLRQLYEAEQTRRYAHTTKNCAVFFTVLAIIGLAMGVIATVSGVLAVASNM